MKQPVGTPGPRGRLARSPWLVAARQVLETDRELQPFQLALQHFFMGIAAALGLPSHAPVM